MLDRDNREWSVSLAGRSPSSYPAMPVTSLEDVDEELGQTTRSETDLSVVLHLSSLLDDEQKSALAGYLCRARSVSS